MGRGNRWNKRLLAFSMLVVLTHAVSAQTETTGLPPGDQGPYTIRRVDFNVTGRSLPAVMMRKIDPYGNVVGSRHADKAALEAFIADRRQILMNERVLASVLTSYDTTPAASGGRDVTVHFTTTDTWNLVALPYAKYNSNTGLLLSARGRDYNFAGSMRELSLNLDYTLDTAGKSGYSGDLSFSLPFSAFNADWTFGFSETAGLWSDGTARSTSMLSLEYSIPRLGFPASVTAYQGASFNAPGNGASAGTDPATWFFTEGLAATASLPITDDLGHFRQINLGPLLFTPNLSVSLNWKPGETLQTYESGISTSTGNGPYGTQAYVPKIGNNISYGLGGVVTTFGAGLSFGRVDWDGNMRNGLTLSLSDTNSYNAQYQDLVSDVNLAFSGYCDWDGRIGVAGRINVLNRFSPNLPADRLVNLGWYLRGIYDDRISGAGGIFINLSLPIKLFDFPSHAVLKTKALDFEVQAQPFVDAALVHPDYTAAYSNDWLWYSGGLELLAFPQGLRSFIVRASAGWDLKNVLKTKSITAPTPDNTTPYEISFGLGLMY